MITPSLTHLLDAPHTSHLTTQLESFLSVRAQLVSTMTLPNSPGISLVNAVAHTVGTSQQHVRPQGSASRLSLLFDTSAEVYDSPSGTMWDYRQDSFTRVANCLTLGCLNSAQPTLGCLSLAQPTLGCFSSAQPTLGCLNSAQLTLGCLYSAQPILDCLTRHSPHWTASLGTVHTGLPHSAQPTLDCLIRHSSPSAASTWHSPPSAASTRHSPPSAASVRHSLPLAASTRHSLPSAASVRHSLPSAASHLGYSLIDSTVIISRSKSCIPRLTLTGCLGSLLFGFDRPWSTAILPSIRSPCSLGGSTVVVWDSNSGIQSS